MGEEEKKQPEENKEEPIKKPVAEKKIDEVPEEKKKKKKLPEDESKEAAKNPEKVDSKEITNKEPPPPQEIILRVYMHCEGCARKVRKCLNGLEGVEKVETDCKASKVVVKGEKADPLKVLERVQRKSHRQVELLSPIPTPPAAAEEPKKAEPIEIANPTSKKEEVITVVLMVHMHCEACAQEIRRQIQKMKGVESAMPDLKSSEVVVKGSFKPQELINFIHKRTGKQAVIIKTETENNPVEENAKKDPKTDEKKEGKDTKKGDEKDDKEKKEAATGGVGGGGDIAATSEAAKPDGEEKQEDNDPKQEMKKSELLYNYHPQNYQLYQQQNMFIHQEHEQHVYPPQIFSDENPNSCSIM